MRNYTEIYFCEVDARIGSTVSVFVLGGQFEGQASEAAIEYANEIQGSYDSVNVLPEEKHYVLLSAGLIQSYFIDFINFNVANGLRARTSIDNILTGFGLEVGTSPKSQKIVPWNGKRSPGRPRGS